jgi:hypothetical protein
MEMEKLEVGIANLLRQKALGFRLLSPNIGSLPLNWGILD